MNIQEVFRKIDFLKGITMDMVLFEGKYPVLFTCRDEDHIYLFICCLVNSQVARWIGAETRCDILVDLLEDKITIRDAFLKDYAEKMIIEYDGLQKRIHCEKVDRTEIPEEYLPTKGEYMEAEDGEFEEEIQILKSRMANREISVNKENGRLLIMEPYRKTYILSDEFFGVVSKLSSDVFFEIVSSYRADSAYV